MFSGGELKNHNYGNDWTLSGVIWCAFGVPAILAWVAVGLAWLLEPHLAVEAVDPMAWAVWGAGLWYGLLILIFGGWLGLLVLVSMAP